MYWLLNRCSSLNSISTTHAPQDIHFLSSRCKVYYNIKSEFLYEVYNSPESSNWDNLTMPSSECRSWEYDTALFENTFVTQVSLCKTFKTIYYDYIVIWPFFTYKSVHNAFYINWKLFKKKEQISFDNSGISNTEVKKLSGLIFVYVFIYWFIEKPGMQKETVSHTCHCSIYGWIYARVARNGNIFRQVCFFFTARL